MRSIVSRKGGVGKTTVALNIAQEHPTPRFCLVLAFPPDSAARYRQAALDCERPMRELVIEALEQYLEGS